ncbi:MAG: hypothetical protein Q7R57_08375 [Dehalococcoidales bacterium]|nr:hypothetical protein [Dehalococcoidales bacterium]
MEIDKRVESMESEFKLMRGELKQTLTSVRDYLLNLKLPPSQEATLLAAAMSGGSAEMTMDGKFSVERDNGKNGPGTDELLGENEPGNARDASDGEEDAESGNSEETELSEENEEDAESTDPDKEELMQDEITEPIEEAAAASGTVAMAQGTPPVNLLANLIRWVAIAKREIGGEQLPTFLEVYGISGHLSSESKDIILQLAEVTTPETADASTAEVWSKLILELHGILAGGEAPLQPLAPVYLSRKEERPKPKSSKLKLVLSDDDGNDHEFSLNIKPDEN